MKKQATKKKPVIQKITVPDTENDKMREEHGNQKGKNPLLSNELDDSARIAYHYGFTPIVIQKVTSSDKIHTKEFEKTEIHDGETEDRVALLRLFQEGGFARMPQPPMLYLERPFSGSTLRKKTAFDMVGLEILNVGKATAEALIIKTAWVLLEEAGASDLRLEINSLGDKESFARFERDLNAYVRKNIHTVSTEFRQKYKENHLNILTECEKTMSKEDSDFCSNAPRPFASLSEQSRLHFKEVLEFLEMASVPYQIEPTLLPNIAYASHTTFEIKGKTSKNGSEITLAYGGRYNHLAKKIGFKKDIPACGATILIPKTTKKKIVKRDKMKRPQIYMVQLGNLAKLQALNIIELLRSANITVYHSLTKENIGGQLQSAEYLQVSHVLIVGQKEALENSIVVRSVDLRAQETVPVAELCHYLKKLL